MSLGDLDGDGDLDAVSANAHNGIDGSITVLFNSGDGTLENEAYYYTDGPVYVAIGDLDGDLDADLAVTSYSIDQVVVLFNNGDGSFVGDESYYYDVGDWPMAVTMGDLDSDGDADLAVANFHDDYLSVLMNQGDGTFDADVHYPTVGSPYSVAMSDVDNDGHIDLVAAIPGNDDLVAVLVNQGDGTFSSPVSYDAGDGPRAVALGDLDGDGDPDMATANEYDGTVSIFVNQGDGTFSADMTYDAGNDPTALAIGDLDGNGDIDIATANYNYYEGCGDDYESTYVSVLLNEGGARFLPPVHHNAGIHPHSVALGDLDGDRDLDLASVSYYPNWDCASVANSVAVLFNNSDGTLASNVDYEVGESPKAIALGDLNGDAYEDLAVAHADYPDGEHSVAVLFNLRNGTFAAPVFYETGDGPYSVAIADLDKDGDADLVTADRYSNSVSVFFNNGEGILEPQAPYIVADAPRSVAVGDLDGDGDLDLATANYSANNLSVLLNDGSGSFSPRVDYASGTYGTSVALGDLDSDGDADIAMSLGDSSVSVNMNHGDGTFGQYALYGVEDFPSSLAIGDLNGDGSLDLATANIGGWDYSYSVSVLLNKGDGAFFDDIVENSDGIGPYSVAIGDLDLDGDSELVVANQVSGNAAVFINHGNASWDSKIMYGAGDQPSSVVIGDLDGDEDPDLAVANETGGNVSVLLNHIVTPEKIAHNLTSGIGYPKIQPAINAAVHGDEIAVDPRKHFENLDFHGKKITVRSLDPLDQDVVESTIIDGGLSDTVVRISAGTLSGFTVTRGHQLLGQTDAAGVHATGTAVVSYNVITGNDHEGTGAGGVGAFDSAVILANRIVGNTTQTRGGGVLANGNCVVIDNLITGNTAEQLGGGLRARDNAVVRNNTITGNSTPGSGGGVYAQDEALFVNNIIAFNDDGTGLHAAGTTIVADYNAVFGNTDGDYGGTAVPGPNDVSVDPQLDTDGIHLLATSPCINAGTPELVPLNGETDIDGQSRIQADLVEIGADESIAPATCDGDANGDGAVDPLDAGYVLARLGCPVGTGDASCDAADQNADGAVDPLDAGYVLARFGVCPK